MDKCLIFRLPTSHHKFILRRLDFCDCQNFQKPVILSIYPLLVRREVLNFHTPGPLGGVFGGLKQVITALWSEKGKEVMSHRYELENISLET